MLALQQTPYIFPNVHGVINTPENSGGGSLPNSPLEQASSNDGSLPSHPSAVFREGGNPHLVVFDLDYTVWPFDCDKDVVAPFTVSPYGGVYDRYGRPSNAFSDAPAIIAALVDAGIPVAYASRNPSAGSVEALLRSIAIAPKTRPHIRTLWDALPSRALFHAYSSAGYGRGKARHFAAIKGATNIEYTNMLFFDDLVDNIVHANAQGTTSVHLGRRGLTWDAMAAGIYAWRERNAAAAAGSAAHKQAQTSSGTILMTP